MTSITIPSSFSRLRLPATALAGLALLTALNGCVPLVVGGAAVAGTGMVVTDRRTAGTQLEDESIEQRSGSAVRTNFGDRVHVNVTSYNRQVLLTGEVPTAQDKERVEQYVSRVENVRGVVNALDVAPASSFSQRSQDSLITAKVKASFVDAKDIYSNAFKVSTERGVVYLMGRVSKREADRTAEIARGVSGVSKVVRVYELISEQELAELGRQQAPAASTATPAPAPVAAPAPAPAAAPQGGAVVTPVR
ncbi:BON domain-containing protein [Xylophilus rhododendri]|uniref:BON domain-containing protein n=1 Tax=Xylophilus rhododendri TaxID=2697032 RepID=A0A857J6E7_9BURK|nr:BON domain-containing protein [Xylophilus rhododendri]QHI98395.1 BON domain-containing protein [Xylophilus rhododendri]